MLVEKIRPIIDVAHAPSAPPRLSVVAPCYNEAAGLAEFHRQATAAARDAVGDDYEMVLVNDGSKDATLAVLHALAERDRHVVVVNLSRNFGHQRALSAGLQFCRGERILVIDADLQDPPGLLQAMMRAMDDGADVAYGRRRSRSGETRFKLASSSLFYRLLQRLTDVPIPTDTGDFRLMSRRALDVLNGMPEQFRFIRGMVSWIGMKQVPIDYDRKPRIAGETGYSLGRMIAFALDAITGFSVVPLRIATWLGLATSVASLLLMGYTLGAWLLGATVAGWTSLASIVLTIGGVQLLVLGILGEYVGRLYMEAKRRPLFVVSDVYRAEPEP
jgi:dolichol-phosphate mannosyltransferase